MIYYAKNAIVREEKYLGGNTSRERYVRIRCRRVWSVAHDA